MTEWRKSTFSDNGSCVEFADTGDDILVRNSNHPDAGTLRIDRRRFTAWLAGIKAGEFDDLA